MKRKVFMLLMLIICISTSAQTEEDLWIKNGNRNIFGLLSRPAADGREKYPVAIISHGFNGSHWFGKDYFPLMQELGYMCYTFDFPCGSVRNRSDNNTMNMSALDEVDDLLAVVRYFQSRSDVDLKHIVLIGESQGGLVSALAAARIPKEINNLILIYPALCIPDNWNQRYPTVDAIPDTTRLWNVPMGRRYFEEIRGLDPYKEIVKYKKPVLIIHGDMDKVVPLSYSQRAQKVYKKARLEVIEGAGHGFKPTERAKAFEFIRAALQ